MSKNPWEVIEVDIFDQRYSLRLNTPAEQGEILELAAEVDLRMREIASQTRTVDSLKVAILTALHLAQEKREKAVDSGHLESAVESGTRKWIEAIDSVLPRAAGQIAGKQPSD